MTQWESQWVGHSLYVVRYEPYRVLFGMSYPDLLFPASPHFKTAKAEVERYIGLAVEAFNAADGHSG